MGKAQRHTPRCHACGVVLQHYLMIERRLKGGRKIHYCIKCNEAYKQKSFSGNKPNLNQKVKQKDSGNNSNEGLKKKLIVEVEIVKPPCFGKYHNCKHCISEKLCKAEYKKKIVNM